MFEYNITTSLTYHFCFIEVPVSREKSDWSCACVLRIHNKENYDEHHRLTKKPRENPHSHQRINNTRYPPFYSYTQDELNTTTRTQTQTTWIKHEPSYKQLWLMTNRTSYLCRNRSRHCC
jgi:hypothetical protein